MRFWVTILLCAGSAWVLRGADATIEFNRDVRPILSDKCFHCHGPDAVAKKIPRRLDSEAAAKAELRGKRVIVDGDPESSELVTRVETKNKASRMPPVYSGLTLTESEIETLREWVAQGARWQKHWSFIPPRTPPLAAVQNGSWTRNPIDNFILSRLEREGLTPSTEASRETLLRRVSLDLTGLPPTLEEMDAFLNDRSEKAYEDAVDRLLDSPRYGERMAAQWLDAARYADSNGYQFDGERYMWRWRDWVIDSFNRNQRFDQFTVEQIAGDMLPGASLDQMIATGFNRNHRANTEDGIIDAEYAVEYVVDRVETTSTVFLGLTLGCARCHNHKYDPFTQKEFYQLYAYFNNVPERGRAMKYGNSPPQIAAPTGEQQRALGDLQRSINSVEDFLRRNDSTIGRAQRSWERDEARTDNRVWALTSGLEAGFTLDDAGGAKSKDGTVSFEPGIIGQAASFDGTAYLDAAGLVAFDIQDRFTLAAWVYSDSTPDGSVVTKMEDKPKGKGYGMILKNGKVHVHLTNQWNDDSLRVETKETIAAGGWHHLTFTYTGSRLADGVRIFIDGKPAGIDVELDRLYRPFTNAGRVFEHPLRIGAGRGEKRRFRGLIDDVRIFSRVLNDAEIAALAVADPIQVIARKPAAERTEGERLHLRWSFLENNAPAEIREAWRRLTDLKRRKEKLEREFPTVMVMAERPARRDTFLLVRGAYDKPGEKVEPGIPSALGQLPPGAPNNRLGFAKWLVAPDNPLLARVTVNRFWQLFFGAGLVKTAEDFGSQGEWPSHPDLLDWLATDFIRSGWDVKALAKLIVTSATYRQSSKSTPELIAKDPANRLLARGPRYRLPAEMIRDQALLVSGLLFEKLGGPAVKPYQPPGLWKELTMQDKGYFQSKGNDLYRRSLYTFWRRTVAPPMMMNFDSSMRESCVVREARTNTPLQALNLMNDVTFVEAARLVGQRMMKEGGDSPGPRLRHGFRLVSGRKPSAEEEQILGDSLRYHLDYFSGKQDEVQQYLSLGESPVDPDLDQRELAAYASVASLMLNLDEPVTKE